MQRQDDSKDNAFQNICTNFCICSNFCLYPTRFYLRRDMTNLDLFTQGSLEWPFSELFFSDVSLWNQYKYIAFNIFKCRTLIISYKMLIITGISNEATNKIIIHTNIMSKRHNILPNWFLYFKCRKNWKRAGIQSKTLSSCFIADDSHVKTIWLHVLVFTKQDFAILEIMSIYKILFCESTSKLL